MHPPCLVGAHVQEHGRVPPCVQGRARDLLCTGMLGITRSLPAEPSFVHADVIRASPEGAEGGDDRVYFFFTEVSVEYEFVSKLMIPRVARVCKVRPLPGSLWFHLCTQHLAQAPHAPPQCHRGQVGGPSAGHPEGAGTRGAWHL